MKPLLAALVIFTKLPLYKWITIPAENFRTIINYWAITGILTSAITVGTLYMANIILPTSIAILLAILARVLFTGAFHEDGLADFFDGFGGGRGDKNRILEIMKDSHIGVYGMIALLFYFALLYITWCAMPVQFAISIILIGDPLCKIIVSHIPSILPYARDVKESKYAFILEPALPLPIISASLLISAIIGVLIIFNNFPITILLSAITPILLFIYLIFFLQKRIKGYTGDCCGAIFLMCELSFYITALSIIKFLAL